ncbi:asparagine synthase-related protein [Kitasatospora sp. MAP5-34]|uniref:asparagine synthetase B family protein n=1 Tax=Kitasatospora sp. MAP5-34 TaxID=3035102 RepID=UPI0024747915|nr:asparagine synthase-related protein [Kitasatospora sp. MAP5-34]
MCLTPGAASGQALRADRLAGAGIEKLLHRGPDGHGVCGDAQSAVAMCRLRLRSLPDDRVPFTAEAGSVAYAYNGEVYAVGPGALSGTGRTTVPAGGLDEGQAVDEHDCSALDGMYAQVRRSPDGCVEVSRDPFGIKPLYLRRHPHGTAVASEIPALLDLFGPVRVRPEAIGQFLLFGRVVDGGTFFQDIEPVAPGSRLLLKEGRVQQLVAGLGAPQPTGGREPATPEELRAAVSLAVERVLVSDRPLGLALSGGLDSTILATELSRRGVRELATVSVVPRGGGDGVTDLSALRLTGTAWRGWRHRWIGFGPDDLLDGVADAVRVLGEPTAMTSVPMYAALARLARESGIVALLLGEGADELFGGYRSYLRLAELTEPAEFYLSADQGRLVRDLLPSDAYAAARDALGAALPPAGGRPAAEVVREFEYQHSLEPLLRRSDHLLMAQGVEGRTPFLHGGLPALAASLPFSRLVDHGQTKLPLRRAFAAELPAYGDEVKKPFRAPVTDWLTGRVAPRVHAELTGHRDRLVAAGLRPDGLDELLGRVLRGDQAVAGLVFPLLTLGSWLEWLGA